MSAPHDRAVAAEEEIVSAGVFDAPRAVVFRAFTDPRHLARWWGPKGFTNTFETFDPRPGGAWRFVMHGPDGTDYHNASEFVEIVAPELIVFQHVKPMHRFRMTITFAVEGARTRLTWRMLFESADAAAKARPFVPDANEQNFDRLAAELGAMRKAP